MNTTTPHAAASIDKVLKILVIGNPKCGKSSIISRYVHQSFDSIYKTTVGADFIRKDISITLHSTPLRVRIQLWDIAGQDRFQKLTRAYFNNAKGVAIVCDVSRDGTVEAVAQWKKEVDGCIQSIDPTASIPVVLFANKADLLEDAITACRTGARMERVCREHGMYSK
jgi:small GTP-binding protein